ncbi:MAG: hypothetical protein Q7R49_00660 [Candidatus Daviesbacteria bacterium]|nr:hypothetical protein [Candidatus Daviesbacteria bacterium]
MDNIERDSQGLTEQVSTQAFQRLEAILRDHKPYFPFEIAAAAKLWFPESPMVKSIRIGEEDLRKLDGEIRDYTSKALMDMDIVRASNWAAARTILVGESREDNSSSNLLADEIIRVYSNQPPLTSEFALIQVEKVAIFENLAIFAPLRVPELGLTDEHWDAWVSGYRTAQVNSALTVGAALNLLFPEKGKDLEVPQSFCDEVGNLIELYSKPDEYGFYTNDHKLAQTLKDFKILSAGFTSRVEH